VQVVKGLLSLLLLALFTPQAPTETPPKPESNSGKVWVFIGTYTNKPSKGIYRCQFDSATGKLGEPSLAVETESPSFLAIHPTRRFLYAVGEVGIFRGKQTGSVSAFALDPKTGALTFLNRESSGGSGPCHLVVDKQGKHVLVANYGGGSACVLPIGDNGHLGEATAFVQHKGTSVDKSRQEAPHAHSINLDAANHFACVADLGLDKVLVYRFDASKGTLTPNDPPSVAIAPGAGPRHFAFHPDGHHAYVINEMHSTVTALDYDPGHGTLKTGQTITTLPKGFSGNTSTAEVVVHPSGQFLYGSNRGHNSIVAYAIDPKSGTLTLVGHQGDGIKTPRNFTIDPSGKYLLVANQDSKSIVVFAIDLKTGELSPTGQRVEVPFPVCLRMVRMD